jgi:hypothetical protein
MFYCHLRDERTAFAHSIRVFCPLSDKAVKSYLQLMEQVMEQEWDQIMKPVLLLTKVIVSSALSVLKEKAES